jgi:hypothetical protein
MQYLIRNPIHGRQYSAERDIVYYTVDLETQRNITMMNVDDLDGLWRKWTRTTRGIISTYFFKFWGKPREILVMQAGVPAEIRIENLPNASLRWFAATATGRSEKVTGFLIIGFIIIIFSLLCLAVSDLSLFLSDVCMIFQNIIFFLVGNAELRI